MKKKVSIVIVNSIDQLQDNLYEVFESDVNAEAFIRGFCEKTLTEDEYDEIDWMDDGILNDINYLLHPYGFNIEWYVNINYNPAFK